MNVLELEIEGLKDTISNLEEQLSDSNDENNELNDRLEDSECKLDGLNDRLEDALEEKATLEAQVEELEAKEVPWTELLSDEALKIIQDSTTNMTDLRDWEEKQFLTKNISVEYLKELLDASENN